MKKTVSFVAAFCLLFAMATTVHASADVGIAPFWTDTSSVTPTMDFSSGSYTVSIVGMSGTTKTACSVVIYRVNGNTETRVASLSDSKTGAFGVYTGSYSFVKGYTYRMAVTTTVYRNGGSEVIPHSITQTY